MSCVFTNCHKQRTTLFSVLCIYILHFRNKIFPTITMVKYTLNYFEITGLGEPVRLLFHAAGAEFTDNRISFANWPPVIQI